MGVVPAAYLPKSPKNQVKLKKYASLAWRSFTCLPADELYDNCCGTVYVIFRWEMLYELTRIGSTMLILVIYQ